MLIRDAKCSRPAEGIQPGTDRVAIAAATEVSMSEADAKAAIEELYLDGEIYTLTGMWLWLRDPDIEPRSRRFPWRD